MGINVKELKVKVYLLENIRLEDTMASLASIIDRCLSKSEKYLEFHEKREFKYYTFNLLYPLETDKVYKEGNIYTFIVRTVDSELEEFLVKNLVNYFDKKFKVLTISSQNVLKKQISDIYSITPVIIKSDEGYWKNNISLDDYEKRLKLNLIKKYNSFTQNSIDEDFEFFNHIRFNNQKPISTKYKNVSVLGDKLNINIADNSLAQELIYFALGTGLGEMNGRGFGFINFKWL